MQTSTMFASSSARQAERMTLRNSSSLTGEKLVIRSPSRAPQTQRPVHALTAGVKLPATHLQSTQAALAQLNATKNLNSEVSSRSRACIPAQISTS